MSQPTGQPLSRPLPTALIADSRIVDVLRKYGSLIALAALLLYNVLFTNNFVSIGTFNANMTQVATIVIVAVGMTFVIATMPPWPGTDEAVFVDGIW